MYYLLEDNRIIDSENLPKNWEIFSISFDRMYVKIFEDIIITQTFDIKKQSENVFDLIEEGDLIRCDRCDGIFEVSDIDLFDEYDKEIYDCDKSFISYPANAQHLENEISAIYKPDEKGNYIKVWEKKEDA